MIEFLTLIISVVAQVFLGLLVYRAGSNHDVNRTFFGLSISLSLWSIFTYWSLHPQGVGQLILVRMVLGAATLLCCTLFLTFLIFPQHSLKHYKVRWFLFPYTLFVMILTQTPLVFKGLDTSANVVSPIVAPGIVFFMVQVFICIGGAIILLIRRFIRSGAQAKKQLRPIIIGTGVSFSGIVLTNFIFVAFFKYNGLLFLGPALTLVFLASMAYAILRHRLFDVRATAARATTYLLSLGTVVIFYLIIAFGLTELFTLGAGVSTRQRLFYVTLAVVSGFVYRPVKVFFDRITRKVFFRDAYDPQQFLDSMNDELVGNIELQKLLSGAEKLITNSLKSIYCVFYILEDGEDVENKEVFGNHNLSDPLLVDIVKALHVQDSPLIINDTLTNQDIRHKLNKADIYLARRLSTKTSTIGYLLLGEKRSGNLYSHQDVKILDIVADEIAIAAENALRFEQIRKFNITLQREVDEATSQLRRTNNKLLALDEAKDEFISMASHQLRTPLTSIKGFISLILDGDAGKVGEQQQELLRQAFLSSQRMVYLISDLLNVSRLRTGKFIIEPEDTYLPDATHPTRACGHAHECSLHFFAKKGGRCRRLLRPSFCKQKMQNTP